VAGFVKHFIFSLKGLRVKIRNYIPVGREYDGLPILSNRKIIILVTAYTKEALDAL
jgi:hypothetical protein